MNWKNLDANDWIVLAISGGAIVFLLSTFSSGTQLVFEPGDTADVKMGQSITLKLPRGQYEMVGGGTQITLLSSKDVGQSTVVTLLIGVEPVAYEITVRFVSPQGDEHELDIEAEPVDA